MVPAQAVCYRSRPVGGAIGGISVKAILERLGALSRQLNGLLFALIAVVGLAVSDSKATAELDLNDRSAMMQLGDYLLRCVITFEFLGLKASDDQQRTALEQSKSEYSTAVLHLYKLLKVRDGEALARRRWTAVFDQVKWEYDHDRLHVELKICTRIEAAQRELMAHYRLEQKQGENGVQ